MASCPRERQEQWEIAYLAEWAARSAYSRGRARPEPPDPVRTAFQRDRDRILHSKAFRRLKHKTQVFIDPEEDHFRTRLTHTLEVAQIARTIARALRLNEDLTEAIALAHDLGHPPFGHAGEEALDAAYREFVPHASFRHDVQSLRVVDLLERRTGEILLDDPDQSQSPPGGLNLTWEVRDGIAYHSKGRKDLSEDAAHRASTLEGKVVRIADRVAYINHDIDDAIRAGVLRRSDLPREQLESLGHTHSERIATMVIDIVTYSEGKPIVEMSPPIAACTDQLKDFLFERVYWNAATGNQDLRKAQHVIRALFHLYMEQPERMTGDVSLRELPVEERAQRVCDYIAGMTDRYAVACFDRHFVPKSMRAARFP
ncbi:MAG: deoxyguanosinetriphosphate triphosphohydrolase [Chloroherpetonaceae bacterium]|nr:deoxyguanosinetriphosphate triphosphohydrolase [Chthonomonadaceae bacterium]MDW8207227.1 deoxyguanosinetriphosphate triphosphohydrolase [Chloroherpetonaceae bacterium]